MLIVLLDAGAIGLLKQNNQRENESDRRGQNNAQQQAGYDTGRKSDVTQIFSVFYDSGNERSKTAKRSH